MHNSVDNARRYSPPDLYSLWALRWALLPKRERLPLVLGQSVLRAFVPIAENTARFLQGRRNNWFSKPAEQIVNPTSQTVHRFKPRSYSRQIDRLRAQKRTNHNLGLLPVHASILRG